jgi:hypothetical protein
MAVQHTLVGTKHTALQKRQGKIVALLRRYRVMLALAFVLSLYPAFVLGTVYATTLRSDLPGGRYGPKDAYRHSLASAIVAYTGSPVWVEWVTMAMEGDGRDHPARAMDIHNNRIGTRIGLEAKSWDEMHETVLAAVHAGAVDADGDRIRWLPPEQWQNRLY